MASDSPVTAAQVQAAVQAKGITRIEHHRCSGCHYMTAYAIEGDQVTFDPGCECVGCRPHERRGWEDLADWINRQSSESAKRAIARRCGVER